MILRIQTTLSVPRASTLDCFGQIASVQSTNLSRVFVSLLKPSPGTGYRSFLEEVSEACAASLAHTQGTEDVEHKSNLDSLLTSEVAQKLLDQQTNKSGDSTIRILTRRNNRNCPRASHSALIKRNDEEDAQSSWVS